MPKGQFTCPEEIKSKGVPPQGHQPLWGSDFPWSMWAMMEKFRIFDWSVKKIHLRKMGNGQVILGCTPRRSPADRRRGQAPALQNRVMIGAPAGAPALRALRIPAATALVFQGHAPMAARRAQPVQRSRSQGLRGNRDTCRPRRGVVGPSYGSFAFGQARKLIPSAGPPLPTEPAAQPLAALPPYGCGVPLAGTSLGFGGGPSYRKRQPMGQAAMRGRFTPCPYSPPPP